MNSIDSIATLAAQIICLSPEAVAEATMLRGVYANASTNDGRCRVAEVARNLAAVRANSDEEGFTAEAYMDIVLRDLRTARGDYR
jgi:hypothetical protein